MPGDLSFNYLPLRPIILDDQNPSSHTPRPKMPGPRKLHVAVAGLGRVGTRHAFNFLHQTVKAKLVAVFSIAPRELEWAHKHLEPFGVQIFDDYEKMLELEGLEAVVIATATKVHAEETVLAIKKGMHVLCERPLSLDVDSSAHILRLAHDHPSQKVMVGFSRRFDHSYQKAHSRIRDNAVGRPTIVHSRTANKLDTSPSFDNYVRQSGGMFLDSSIHDIDLALWFLGENSIVKSVYAVGVRAAIPELKDSKVGDADNVVGIVEFWGGKIAYFYGSRTMASGHQASTEIVGTQGSLTINATPRKDEVEMWEPNGVRRELAEDYWGRFAEAFREEAKVWTECCLDEDKKVPVNLRTSVEVVRIAECLQQSLRTGKKINFDETGRRLEVARL